LLVIPSSATVSSNRSTPGDSTIVATPALRYSRAREPGKRREDAGRAEARRRRLLLERSPPRIAGGRGGYLPKLTCVLVTGTALGAAALGVAALGDGET